MTGKQGFASMDPDKRRVIASKGGKRAHELGKGHKWTPEEASEAGKVGGKISRKPKKGDS
jgi:uncharacterized protein